ISRGGCHPSIDSLKTITDFLRSKSGQLNTESYTSSLSKLDAQLNSQQYINALIDQRSAALKRAVGSNTQIPALLGIEKEVFYAREKAKVFQEMAQEPSAAEEKALEYLRGVDGFEKALIYQNTGVNRMQQAAHVEDMEKMGFQTRRQLSAWLQKQFGSNFSGVQEKMSDEIKAWQKQAQGIEKELKKVQQEGKTAIVSAKKLRQSAGELKRHSTLSFKPNPMRCFPFGKRIEKGLDFQTSRASGD